MQKPEVTLHVLSAIRRDKILTCMWQRNCQQMSNKILHEIIEYIIVTFHVIVRLAFYAVVIWAVWQFVIVEDCQGPVNDDDAIVYITETGSKYHRAGCRYLRKSSHPMSLEEAIDSGYEPCSVCNPPR